MRTAILTASRMHLENKPVVRSCAHPQNKNKIISSRPFAITKKIFEKSQRRIHKAFKA